MKKYKTFDRKSSKLMHHKSSEIDVGSDQDFDEGKEYEEFSEQAEEEQQPEDTLKAGKKTSKSKRKRAVADPKTIIAAKSTSCTDKNCGCLIF